MPTISRKRQAASAASSAIKWRPSEQFDGIDGSWSTFIISVGDDDSGSFGQDFRILPSTSGSAVYVPAASAWCTQPSTEECNQARGIEPFDNRPSTGFQPTRSAAWREVGNFTTALGPTFDYSNSTLIFGFDNVGIGRASRGNTSIIQSLAVGLLDSTDFFLGYVGLSTIPIPLSGTQIVPFLPVFGNPSSNNIPSRSYAYTAGASYANGGKRVPGDLVLGGYDASRFTRATSVQMPSGTENNTLVASVRSIGVTRNNVQTTQVVPQTQAFSAIIDSTLPYLWLPDDACDAFVREFGLQENTTANLFTVDENTRSSNQDASISIQIGNDALSFTSIILPYAAFDLEARWPLVEEPTRYFPIKRSPTNNFILGRAFLQEAYIVVDYDQRNFTVAQAVFTDPMPEENLISITPSQFGVIETTGPDNSTDGGGGGGSPDPGPSLSAGEIAGIVLGSVFLIIAAIFLFIYYRKYKLKRQAAAAGTNKSPGVEEIGGAAALYDKQHPGIKDRRTSELEAPSERSSTVGAHYRRESELSELESPPMQSVPKFGETTSYFASDIKRAPVDPNPNPYSAQLAELPAESGPAELGAASAASRGRPARRRNRSGGSNSRNDIGSPGDRVTIIMEGDEGTYPAHVRPVSGDLIEAETALENALRDLEGDGRGSTSTPEHRQAGHTESRFTENISEEPETLGPGLSASTAGGEAGSSAESEPKVLGLRSSLPTAGDGLLSGSDIATTTEAANASTARDSAPTTERRGV